MFQKEKELVVVTGKAGYIQFLIAMAEMTSMTKEEIENYRNRLEIEIEEGLYQL